MTLTKMERLLMISSLQTLKAQLMGLKAQGVELPEDAPTVEGCDFSIAALESGFSIFYPHLQDAVGASFFEGDEMPHAECVFTLDVLEMFRRIIDYRGNNPDDDAAKSPTLSFMGFDGNCEGAYAALAKFAMGRGGYCPELREKKNQDACPDGGAVSANGEALACLARPRPPDARGHSRNPRGVRGGNDEGKHRPGDFACRLTGGDSDNPEKWIESAEEEFCRRTDAEHSAENPTQSRASSGGEGVKGALPGPRNERPSRRIRSKIC